MDECWVGVGVERVVRVEAMEGGGIHAHGERVRDRDVTEHDVVLGSFERDG